LYLLERGHTLVRASDRNLSRLSALSTETKRLRLFPIPAVQARADVPLPWKETPRTILLDVPCSGLGVLSRNPDSKWKRRCEDLPGLTKLQERMLLQAAHALPSGGRLVYITCTLNPDENETQMEKLLLSSAGLVLKKRYSGEDCAGLREFFWGAVIGKK
jgi:16S rRNA (cytosine967-C5)-methyltransferase